VVLAAQLMLTMDFLIVIVALPRMQYDLGFSPATLSWVPNGFALAFGGLLLLGGRLGDMIGQVRAFRATRPNARGACPCSLPYRRSARP
jgi:MFS family permease